MKLAAPLAASFAFVLLASSVALAQEPAKERKKDEAPEKKPTLPRDIFSDAKKGDWCVFSLVAKVPDGTEKMVLAYRVTRADDDEVQVEMDAKANPPKTKEPAKTFPRKGAVKLEDYFPLPLKNEKLALSVVSSEDAKKAIEPEGDAKGKRELDCTKVKVEGTTPDGAKMRATLWISKGLKATGLAGARIKIDITDEIAISADMELLGYGNGEKAEWGTTPEAASKAFDEAVAKEKESAKKDEAKEGKSDEGKKEDGKKPKMRACPVCGEQRPMTGECPHCGVK